MKGSSLFEADAVVASTPRTRLANSSDIFDTVSQPTNQVRQLYMYTAERERWSLPIDKKITLYV